jgi:hypothetical protein
VKSLGSPTVYENLSAESGTLPTKEELDSVILNIKRARMWVAIQEERTRRQNGGVFIQSANEWFHSDQTSRIQQLGLLLMGPNMPAGIMWKTMGNNFVQMTPQLAQQIFQATGAQDMQIFGVAEFPSSQMNESPNPDRYQCMTGWPLTFGE